MTLSPLNLGMIASYYSVRYTTIEIFATSVQIGTKIRGMIKILSAASEFDDLAVSVGVASSPLEMMIRHLPKRSTENLKLVRSTRFFRLILNALN